LDSIIQGKLEIQVLKELMENLDLEAQDILGKAGLMGQMEFQE